MRNVSATATKRKGRTKRAAQRDQLTSNKRAVVDGRRRLGKLVRLFACTFDYGIQRRDLLGPFGQSDLL